MYYLLFPSIKLFFAFALLDIFDKIQGVKVTKPLG